jgi:sugar (pentulose or hexulose) kinase
MASDDPAVAVRGNRLIRVIVALPMAPSDDLLWSMVVGPPEMTAIVVLDIGKTNIKLSATTPDGSILETLSTLNVVQDGPPYRHHDIVGLEAWLMARLHELAARHAIDAIVTTAHGAAGVLIAPDGPVLPMIDYDQPLPEEIVRAYAGMAGSYRERGSHMMMGASHLARQMLWQETCWPAQFSRATAMLATPQYWAWRLSGVAASEVTALSAQTHLWSPADQRPTELVKARCWLHLIPPLRPAWETLGSIRPEIAARTGLSPDTTVLCGIHDSSANFYRYQAAGLSDFVVVSTGTWIVMLSDRVADADRERPAHTVNADVHGRPIPGMLTMGGREFELVADHTTGPGSREALARIVATGTMALPSFGPDDGLFPGSARRGRIEGPLAEERSARFSLAALYAALLTAKCIEDMPFASTIVVDGGFVKDPLYGEILAALLPDRRVLVNRDASGTTTGAALLAGHTTRRQPAPLSVEQPDAAGLLPLSDYRAAWRTRCQTTMEPA